MPTKMRKEINLEIDFACLDIGGHYKPPETQEYSISRGREEADPQIRLSPIFTDLNTT